MITRRTHRTWLAAAAAVALAAAACGHDSGPEHDQASESGNGTPADEAVDVNVDEAALQAILDQWRTDADAFGATLSLRVPGHDDIHLASGIDDRDPETPMPTDGTYGIGSVTKTFVAATALQLVDEGKLSLDEPVEAWLPELPHADQITLAMLLGHTSGLGMRNDIEYVFTDLARAYTPEEALAEQLQAPPVGQPGERFNYANGGYIAVGLLIERILDRDLATVIAQRFTEPLSLPDTRMGDGSLKASLHAYDHPGPDYYHQPAPDAWIDFLDIPERSMTTAVFGAGNMISSSADLLDWGEALYTGEVLGPEATANMLEMRRPFPPDPATSQPAGTNEPTRMHYGLGAEGFCLDPAGCGPDEVDLVGHGGSQAGNRTLLTYHPASGTTLAFFANRSRIPYEKMLPGLSALFKELGLT
jgi:D-alanyl-D-alanine carboxypeptidase